MLLDRNATVRDLPLHLVDLPDPEPAQGEVRVRVHVCGVCRTDLHLVEGELPAHRNPIVPGHQVVGLVDRLGPGCRRLALGERVGIPWLRHTCGRCAFCLSGRENLCRASRYTGWDEHGGYAQSAVVPEAYAYRIPDVFGDLDAAPLLCAGIIGYRALRRAELPPGGRLGLYGFGSSAHVVIQIARHRGHEIYVATRGERHRALAEKLGARWTGSGEEPVPTPLDAAIVFAPVGDLVPVALRAVREGGTVVTAGIYMTDLPSMDYESCLFHEKQLRSVEANTRQDGEDLLREAAEIPLRPRVTALPLDGANEALVLLREDRIEGSAVLRIGA